MNYTVKIKNEFYETNDENNIFSTYKLLDEYSLFSLSCDIEKKNNYYNVTDIYILFHNSEYTEMIYKLDDYESITTLNQMLFNIKTIFINKVNEFLNLDSDMYPNEKELHRAKIIYKYQDKVNDIYNKTIELEKLNDELQESLSNELLIINENDEEIIINTNYFDNKLVINFDNINQLIIN
jgi:hypothetical protein